MIKDWMKKVTDWMKKFTLNRILLVLGALAVVLGIVAWAVLFYSGGTYILSSPLPTTSVTGMVNASSTSLADSNASSTDASSTLGEASSTANSTALQEYASTYATPPITWTEGYDTLSIVGATLSGSQLTLNVNVGMGAIAECVPMNLRLVTDEQGDLASPLNPSFTFGENGTCIGTPGSTYSSQEIVFTVDPSSMPLSFTTGGTSNEYFELSTTDAGGISISRPSTNG
jgi:cytoskeletal protein RodZ